MGSARRRAVGTLLNFDFRLARISRLIVASAPSSGPLVEGIRIDPKNESAEICVICGRFPGEDLRVVTPAATVIE
jgi:tRNA G37 N-methylase TrmD